MTLSINTSQIKLIFPSDVYVHCNMFNVLNTAAPFKPREINWDYNLEKWFSVVSNWDVIDYTRPNLNIDVEFNTLGTLNIAVGVLSLIIRHRLLQ